MKKSHLYVVVAMIALMTSQAAIAQGIDDYLDDETLKLSEGYDKRLRYTPSTVIVFDREAIERSGALNIGELLERVVGMHMSRKSSGSSTDEFVRGIGGHLVILHNGVEIAKLLPELLAMPLVDLERVEVVKGSHYPLYAATAVLGTVNLVTRGVEPGERTIGVRGGTLDTRQAWIRTSDRLSGLGYSGFLSHTRTKTTQGQIDEDRQTPIDQLLGTGASFAPAEGYFGAEVTDGRLTLEYGKGWKLHQFINHRKLGTGIGLAQALDPEGEASVTRYSADLRFERDVGKGSFEGRLTYNWARAEYNDLLILPPGTLGGAFDEGVQQSYGESGQEISTEGLYRVSFGRNTMDIGAGGSRVEVKNDFDRRNYVLEPGGSVPVPIGEITDFGDSAPLFAEDYTASKGHLMIRNELKMTDDLAFIGGARADYYSDHGAVLNPRLGFDWVVGQFTNAVLLYGESVAPPSEIQLTSNGLILPLGDDDLEPAKIRLLELAVDHDFRNGLSIVSNLYTYRQIDSIGVLPDSGSPIGTKFTNLSGREEGTGAELVVSWRISDSVRLMAGASVKRIRSDNIDNARASKFQPYIELDVTHYNGWDANLAVISVNDRQRADGDDRPDVDDYTIVNATAIRRDILMPRLDLTLSVQNLSDADAREDISDAIPFDLPVYPRRVLIGLKYSH